MCLIGVAFHDFGGFFAWRVENQTIIVEIEHFFTSHRADELYHRCRVKSADIYRNREAKPSCSDEFLDVTRGISKDRGSFLKACFLAAISDTAWATHEQIVRIVRLAKENQVDLLGALRRFAPWNTTVKSELYLRAAHYMKLSPEMLTHIAPQSIIENIHLFSY